MKDTTKPASGRRSIFLLLANVRETGIFIFILLLILRSP